jgi:hypothetical protein
VCKRTAMMMLLVGGCGAVAAAAPTGVLPDLSVAQIVERNAAARGGLEAWRNVRTMVWIGHLLSNGPAPAAVPFVLQMKRPDKTRFEVTAENEKSIRAFDGRAGWKVRPPRGGKAELTSYTPEEVRFAKDAPGIDGPLIDHEAKGIDVQLDGTEVVEGRPAYRLSVKLPSGAMRRVWVDADTFLDVKYEREARGSGRLGVVSVFYRDYRAIDGLQVPMTIETAAGDGRSGDRMVIDRVLLNPPLDDREFTWPGGANRGDAASARYQTAPAPRADGASGQTSH